MKLGDKIIYQRKKKGMTQEELANQLDVSRQTISKWELSQSTPELSCIVKISELFNVTTDYLIKDEFPENFVPTEATKVETTNTEIINNQEIKKGLLLHQIVGIISTSLGGLFMVLGIILSSINTNWILGILAGFVVMIIGLELLIIKRNPTLTILWTLWVIISIPVPLLFVKRSGNIFNLSTAGGIASCISLVWFIILIIATAIKHRQATKTNPL